MSVFSFIRIRIRIPIPIRIRIRICIRIRIRIRICICICICICIYVLAWSCSQPLGTTATNPNIIFFNSIERVPSIDQTSHQTQQTVTNIFPVVRF